MNRIARKFGFSLVEVILGSIIIAGFVGSTVFTAGEIGKAKRELLAKRDLNSWANVQTMFAAEGVNAPSDNTDVWGTGTGDFGLLYQSTSGTNDTFSVPSAGAYLKASTVETKGQIGTSVCVNAFLVDLNYYASSSITLAPRSNLATTGLSLMDRATYASQTVTAGGSSFSDSTTTTNADDGVTTPTADPMEKPTSLFNFAISVAIAYPTVSASGTVTYSTSTASSLTLDALTQIDWSDSNPIYVLVSASSGTIASASATLNSTSLASGSYGSYAYAYPISLTSLQSLSSNILSIVGTAKSSSGTTVSKTIALTFTQITPTVAFYRYNTYSSTLTAVSSLSTVTVYDVCQPTTTIYSSGYNAFRAYVTKLNGTAVSSVTNASYVLKYLYLYSYLDNVVSSATTSYTLLSGGTAASSYDTTGYYTTITIPATDFLSGATSYAWRATNKGDSTSTASIPYGALFASATASQTLTISPTTLPQIVLSPGTGSKITSTTGVTASTVSYIMATGSYDVAYPLYYIYYNYGTSSLSAVSDPTTSSSSIASPYYSGKMSFGTASATSATYYAKAEALASSAYSPFFNVYGVSSGTYYYEDSKEANTVMKVKFISSGSTNDGAGTLNGHVNGNIQILEDCSFTLNGSFTLGMKLYVPNYPNFTLNGNATSYQIYSTEQDSYPTAKTTVVGAYYWKNTCGSSSSGGCTGTASSISGSSGKTILVNTVPTGYTLPVITNSTTSVALVTLPENLAFGTNSFSITSASNSTINSYKSTTSKYNGNVLLSAGNYGDVTLDGSQSILYLNSGTYYFKSITFNGTGGSIVCMDTGVIIYVKELSLNSSSLSVTTDSSGNYSTSSGGSLIGSISCPVAIYYAGPNGAASTLTLKGRIFGTIYFNGHVSLDACMVMGRVEVESINMNSSAYLFVKQW